ncbi:MAG: hypothetical protein ACM3JB_25320 [Acidobacteriaceae bacterium]
MSSVTAEISALVGAAITEVLHSTTNSFRLAFLACRGGLGLDGDEVAKSMAILFRHGFTTPRANGLAGMCSKV